MEQCGGEISANLAKPLDGGEDRLSALPDDVLVLILLCLHTTAEAVRTSVLARRWRRLWVLLPKLRFHLRPDGNRIRELLDVPDAPELSYLSVTTKGAAADAVTAWLTAAARRLAGGLVYHNMAPDVKANTIELDLRMQIGLALPSLGIFTRLSDLFLRSIQFRGPCDLGNVVSSPRCPCLQKLSIACCSGLHNLSIHSESLQQMELKHCFLWQLTMVTPILQKLIVKYSFVPVHLSGLVANITTPQIVSLVWMDSYDPQYFHLGNLGQVRELQTWHFLIYGTPFQRESNHHCLRLLQRFQFQVLHTLHLTLILHKVEPACPSSCICDQPENWKTDELVLGHLEDVRIIGLKITLDNKMADEGNIMEFRKALAGFSRLETCVQFDTSDNR